MSIKNQSYIIYGVALLCLIVLLSALLYKCQCNPTHKKDKQQVDSVVHALHDNSLATDKKVDSLNAINTTLQDSITHLLAQRDQLKQDLKIKAAVAKQKHQTILQAITDKDTAQVLNDCATLTADFDAYITQTDAEIKASDTIIARQNQLITNKDSIITLKINEVENYKKGINLVSSKYDDLFKDYSKQRKKLNWFRVKEKGFAAIGLGLLTYFIIQTVKR